MCVSYTRTLYCNTVNIYILIPRDGNTINLPYIAYHREFISVLFIVFLCLLEISKLVFFHFFFF